ncbi:MAG: TetR/AcrR family transcriptional regulator [Betaproteobacteria bacterium]|nr:TetR/AcrR family transcriptional regulator [Betaproteobacteria bacterium]
MGKLRDGRRTRRRILAAAGKEFSERGFDGARIAEIARRAHVSKQLVHHHFRGKEGLFRQVHDLKFRPTVQWEETLPRNPAEIIAERFRKRARDVDYIRFLTWEAASARNRAIPGEEERQRRIAQYGNAIRLMQADGLPPARMDHKLVQLAILSLATYPIAFTQITRLVTGRSGTDPKFQREWARFLRKIGARLFGSKAR